MIARICLGRRALLGTLALAAAGLTGCDRQATVAKAGPGGSFPAISSFEPLQRGQDEPPPAGEALVVNFWASWCGPCRAEMPSLQQLDNQLRGKGVRVVAVSIDQDRRLAQEFVRGIRIKFPVYFDAGGGYSTRALGLYTLPETFVVDAAGVIRARVSGARDWSSPDAIRLVTEKALARPSGDRIYRGGGAPY